MSDRDVQREVEENERRVRDPEDVGIEEDVLREDNDGDVDGVPGLLREAFDLGDEADRTRDEEFNDNTRVNDNGT